MLMLLLVDRTKRHKKLLNTFLKPLILEGKLQTFYTYIYIEINSPHA